MENFDKKIADKLKQELIEDLQPTKTSINNMMKKLDEALGKQESTKTVALHPKNNYFITWRFAATILLLGLASYTLYQLGFTSVVIEKGVNQIVVLPDGSKVNMNASSEIKYNEWFWEWNREIHLSGEAFFEVQKGSTFTVSSKVGNTTVLGTSFNVYNREDVLRVKCHTGKVRVEDANAGQSTVLDAGHGVSIKEGYQGLEKFSFIKTLKEDWQNGDFIFDVAPLNKVIAELERQYNIEVKIPKEVGNLLYSGFFKNDNLDQALKFICVPLDLTYTIRNREVIIQELPKIN